MGNAVTFRTLRDMVMAGLNRGVITHAVDPRLLLPYLLAGIIIGLSVL